MDIQTLERQAWALRICLNKLCMAESKGFAVKYSTPNMKRKLLRLITLSNHRWLRRQSKLFNYHPGGFAPSPAQPSGVLGQGILNQQKTCKKSKNCHFDGVRCLRCRFEYVVPVGVFGQGTSL